MEKTSSSLPPIILLQFVHMAFPQFAEKGDQGQYLQQVRTPRWTHNGNEASKSLPTLFFFLPSQDANECWLQMMRVLQQKLEPLESATPMEVELVFTRILVYVVSSGCEMLLHIKRNQLCAVMLT